MSGELPDVGVGLHGKWAPLPGLAGVRGALDGAGAADGRVTHAGEDHVGVIGLDGDAAAIGQHKLVGGHHRLPALAHVRGRVYLPRGAGQYPVGLAQADGHAVDVRMDSAFDVGPGVAAVEAAVDPVHLDAGPDGAVVLGVHHQHGHHRWTDVALLGHLDGELGPTLAIVAGPEQRRRLDAHEDGVGVFGIDGNGPDRHAVHGRPEFFPGGALVLAAVDAVVGPREDAIRVVGIHGHGPDLAAQREGVADPGPVLATVGAVPDAAAETGRSYADTVVLAHNTASSLSVSSVSKRG